MTHQDDKASKWKVTVLWLAFAAPFALGIYLTLRDAIPLLKQ
jgi:hypothetical protein